MAPREGYKVGHADPRCDALHGGPPLDDDRSADGGELDIVLGGCGRSSPSRRNAGHAARRSVAKRLSQPAIWFQLAKMRLTILDKRLTQSDCRRDRAQDADGCASSRSRRSWRHGPIGHDDMFPLFATSSAVSGGDRRARRSRRVRLTSVPRQSRPHRRIAARNGV